MDDRERLAELGRRLEAAKVEQQVAAQRAIEMGAPADYAAAVVAAQAVDRLWQEYGALWHRLHGPAETPPVA